MARHHPRPTFLNGRHLPVIVLCAALCSPPAVMAAGEQAAGAEPAASAHEHDAHAHHQHMMQQEQRFTRTEADYPVPDISLLDQRGNRVALRELLAAGDRPVMLNFIYTSCTAICPMMTSIFARVQTQLGGEAERVRMVSVSIDPEHDSPAALAAYAARFGAGPQWLFLTGSLDDSIHVQQALDAYRGDKMNHTPLTLFRAAAAKQWVRYDGFAGADELAEELRGMLAAATPAPEPAAAARPTGPGAEDARLPARKGGYRDDFARLNAEREGVVVLPSGVQYEVLAAGQGRRPRPGDTVAVSYVGTLANGVVFDSTRPADRAVQLPLDRIAVPGLREALLLMNEGAKWRVVVPPSMGYARSGNNMLRRRDLIYEIELRAVLTPGPGDAPQTDPAADPAPAGG